MAKAKKGGPKGKGGRGKSGRLQSLDEENGEVAGEEIMGVEGMAKGGLADLPVQHAIFGKLIKAGKEFVKGQKKKGGKKDTKKDTEKDTKTDTKTDKEKPLLISPGSDLKRCRDVSTAILASE